MKRHGGDRWVRQTLMSRESYSQKEAGKWVEVIKWVLGEDDQGHSREVALLLAFTGTKKGISRIIV